MFYASPVEVAIQIQRNVDSFLRSSVVGAVRLLQLGVYCIFGFTADGLCGSRPLWHPESAYVRRFNSIIISPWAVSGSLLYPSQESVASEARLSGLSN